MFRNQRIFSRDRAHKLFAFGLILILLNSVFVATGNTAFDSKLDRRIEYLDADLRYVFRNMATIGAFSVVMDQNVTGNVSVSFEKGISIKDAVSIVAKSEGYFCNWLTDTATVVISGTKDIKADNTRNVKLIPLKTAWAASVAQALETVIPKERIRPDIRNNSVEVMVNELELQNINEIVTRLEQDERFVDTEIRFTEIPEEVCKQIIAKYNPGIVKMGIYPFTDILWAAFCKNTAVKGLTSQKFTMIDGREERVFIGDSIPGMNEVYRDGKIKYKIDYTEIGTILNFKILVEDNNQLTVQVKEKVNFFKEPVNIGLSGPKTDAREIESTIRLSSDQPFLLLGSLQRNEFMQMKNSTYTFPILNGLYRDVLSRPERGPVTGIIIIPRLTGNLLIKAAESQNTPPEASQAPENAGSVTVSPNPTAVVSPSPSAEEPRTPTDEEKPALEIDPGKISTEKAQPKNRDSLNSSSFSEIKYIIKKGDTFEKIIKKFGTGLQTVIQRNRLGQSGEMSIGASLIISVSNERIYIVKPKETLWRIAKRYGTTIAVLKDLNSIADIAKVQAGQKIVLPGLSRRIINPKY